MTGRSPAAINVMLQTFAVYLRTIRDIKSSTIDQYISHCCTNLTERHWDGAPPIRSPILTKLLAGWHRQDIRENPKRLTPSIPAIAAVMGAFFQVAAARQYHNNRQRSAEIQACPAATYYMALCCLHHSGT